MKFVSTIIRTTARRTMLAALLLTAVSAGLSQWGGVFWHESASAQNVVTVVNAASYINDPNDPLKGAVTPGTIVAAFGTFITQNNQNYLASTQPLPATLGGVRVTVNGTQAGLFFTAPAQINFYIPENIVDGTANIVVTNSDNSTRTGTVRIVRGAPGIFSARSTGQGVAAAQTTTDGNTFQSVYNPDLSERDVSAGTKTNPNFLVLYTTGVRYTPAANPNDGNGVAESVQVKIQGVPAPVAFAGAAQGFTGLDQINAIIPPELSGFGSVKVTVITNGRTSNEVTIKIGGQFTPVNLTNIAFGETKTGELTGDDQVQPGSDSGSFFFDAYRLTTTTANTTVAIDLRSTQFDAGVLLYSLQGTNLTFFGSDDQSGGYGNGQVVNNNALYLAVIPNPGDYVIYASSSDFAPNAVGTYTLKLTSNLAQQVNYGQTISNAAIAAGDVQTSAGDYLDVYWFNGAINDNARANMNSTALDSFLIFQRNDGEILTSDDNTGGGNNAQVTQRLSSAGIYVVLATPLTPNVTGAYTFSLTRLTSLTGGAELNLFKLPGRELSDERGAVLRPGGVKLNRSDDRRTVEPE